MAFYGHRMCFNLFKKCSVWLGCVYNSFPSIKHTTPSGVDSSRKETSSDPLSPHPLVITLITGVCLSIPFRDIASVYYFTILYHRTTCNWGVSMKFCHPLLGADPSSLRFYPSYSCCPSQNLRGIFLGFRKMFMKYSSVITYCSHASDQEWKMERGCQLSSPNPATLFTHFFIAFSLILGEFFLQMIIPAPYLLYGAKKVRI